MTNLPAAALVEAGRLLSGQEPPAWFTDWLQGVAIGIRDSYSAETHTTKRGPMRERLVDFARNARGLLRDVALAEKLDPKGLELLNFLELPREQAINRADLPPAVTLPASSLLLDLAQRAEEAAKAIRPGGGGDNAAPRQNGLTARALAALFVREAWMHFHPETKADYRSAEMHNAVEALWQHSTGDSSDPGGRDWKNAWNSARTAPAYAKAIVAAQIASCRNAELRKKAADEKTALSLRIRRDMIGAKNL